MPKYRLSYWASRIDGSWAKVEEFTVKNSEKHPDREAVQKALRILRGVTIESNPRPTLIRVTVEERTRRIPLQPKK